MIINKIDKENIITSQVELWSILSNIVNYVHYDKNPKNFYELDVKAIES